MNTSVLETGLETPLNHEFDRQLHTLIQRGYPKLAGLTEQHFIESLEPLRERLREVSSITTDLAGGCLPFVVVLKSDLIPVAQAMARIIRNGQQGFVSADFGATTAFRVINEVELPLGGSYLLTNIDRGRATLNVPPERAMKLIKRSGRSPLTIEEGIAILTHHPDFLIKNNCFSLLASRCGDQRVPALWISERKPKLGWCWDRNPHTWLGSASCRSRCGALFPNDRDA